MVSSGTGSRPRSIPTKPRHRPRIVRRLYFRGDAAFANPVVYEFLEAEGIGYTIRPPANTVLQNRVGHLLKRPIGRPPHKVRSYFAISAIRRRAERNPGASWRRSSGTPYPRAGFIVTNMARPAERVVAFYNQRGTAEQWIKEGKGAIK